MATQLTDRGRCACGMQGEWTDHGTKMQSRFREVTVTDDNGESHESIWVWSDSKPGMVGTCLSTD